MLDLVRKVKRKLSKAPATPEQLLELQLRNLKALPKAVCDTSKLGRISIPELQIIFRSEELEAEWEKTEQAIAPLKLPEYTGGVNIGDQRAIYQMIRSLNPKSVLEVGTHIGCSTVHIFKALSDNNSDFAFSTVDIRDVNDERKKPWQTFKSTYSPRQMIKMLNDQKTVNFVVGSSSEFLAKTSQTFDFIFLDGDHTASTVYKEIPLALKKLNKGGFILLHDYYPNGEHIFKENSVVPGPYFGSQRLIDENHNFEVVPLGALPWKTKTGTNCDNCTSLALVSAI